jgi:hypothetical protein
MADSNLSVKITADIVDLQTKFAVAKAEVNGLTSEMNKLAKASASGIIDSAGSARLQQVAGDLLAARQQASSYAGELEKAGFATSTFSRAMEGGHGSIATATREFRALFDELSSGRTRQTPGTLAIIAQRVIGLGPAALGAVAGVGALAGGLAYLGIRAMQAGRELDQAFLGAQFAGNLEISRAALEQYSTEMAKAGNISATESRAVVASLSSIPGITTPIFRALTTEVSDFARLTGKDAPAAAAELAKAFNAKTSAADFAREIGGVTQAQINMAEQADRSGNAVKEQEAKLSILLTTIGRSTGTIDENNNKVTSSWRNWLGYAGALASGTSIEEVNTDILTRSNQERAKQAELLRQTASELNATKQSPEQTLKTGVATAEKENPMEMQAQAAKSKIDEMSAALAIAVERGEKLGNTNFDKLTAGLAKAREDLSNLQFGPVLERMREQISQVAATWDGTQSGMLAKQAQIAASMLSQVQKNSKEELAIRTEEARLEIEGRRAVGAEAIAAAREQATALSGDTSTGPIQRLQAERQVWSELLAGDKLNAQQRVEVQRTVAQETAEIAKQAAAEQSAIAKSDADTDIAIAKINIEAKRGALEAEVTATQVSAAQKLQILRTLSSQELALDLQSLQNEIATMSQGTAEYERVLNQERELKAKQVLQLEQYDKQYAAEVARQQREQVTAWRATVSEIENAENQLINDVLGKRKSLGQSLVQIGQQFALKEIENDIKAYTTRMLLANTEETRKKALEQGGLLYHTLTENQKTAATVTSETAQTSAEVAGDSARLASQTSAVAASKAVSATAGASQVMADAAKAASGAYAAVAGVPYIGPILAPIAAGVAYAAVAGYESMASLDTGTNYVPRDMVAQIHQGEAVVPRQYNPAAGGVALSGGGGKASTVNMNIKAIDSRSFSKTMKRGGALPKAIKEAHRRNIRG